MLVNTSGHMAPAVGPLTPLHVFKTRTVLVTLNNSHQHFGGRMFSDTQSISQIVVVIYTFVGSRSKSCIVSTLLYTSYKDSVVCIKTDGTSKSRLSHTPLLLTRPIK